MTPAERANLCSRAPGASRVAAAGFASEHGGGWADGLTRTIGAKDATSVAAAALELSAAELYAEHSGNTDYLQRPELVHGEVADSGRWRSFAEMYPEDDA